MNFDTLEFAVFCAIALLALNLTRAASTRLFTVAVLNVIFLASFATSFRSIVPLLAFAVLGYVAILVSSRSSSAALLVLISGIVAIFVWGKKYTVAAALPQIPFIYLLVGFSYILFRILHLMIDVGQRVQRVPKPLAYLAYLFFFLTFVSGPIERYEDFAGQLAKPAAPMPVKDIHSAFNRIVLGFFLIMVVTPITAYVASHEARYFYTALQSGGVKAVFLYTASAATFVVHLYLNFVGYMEIVIGIGALCGFVLPENFDRPYLAHNFLDFWSRWHITLSEWFKYYVFNPILKTLAERWGTPARMPYFGIVAFFITFLIMGIWHGSTFIYVIYGLFLAFGTATNKIYQLEATRILGKKSYKALCNAAFYQHLSRALTLSYFTVAITCVWLDPAQERAMASLRGVSIALVSYVLLTCAILVTSFLMSRASRIVENRMPSWPYLNLEQRSGMAASWMGVKAVTVLLLAAAMGNSAPEFVYKVF